MGKSGFSVGIGVGYIESVSGRGWGVVGPYDVLYVDMTDRLKDFNAFTRERHRRDELKYKNARLAS